MISSSIWATEAAPAKSPPPPSKPDAMPAFTDTPFAPPLIPNLLEDLCFDAPPVQTQDDPHKLPPLSSSSDWDKWLLRVQGLARIGGIWQYVDPKGIHRLEEPKRPAPPQTPSFDALPQLQRAESEHEFQVRVMEHKLRLDLLGRAFAITQERYHIDCLDYAFKLSRYTAAKEELDRLNKNIFSSVTDDWRSQLMDENTETPRLKLMVLQSLVNGGAAAGTKAPKILASTPAPAKPLSRTLTGTITAAAMSPTLAPAATYTTAPFGGSTMAPVAGTMTRTMTGTTMGTMAETLADSMPENDHTSLSNRRTYDSQYERLMDKLKYKGPRDWHAWANDVLNLCDGCEELRESQLCDQMAKDAFFESIELYYEDFQKRWAGYFDEALSNGEMPAPFQDVATDFLESKLYSSGGAGSFSGPGDKIQSSIVSNSGPGQDVEDDKLTSKWCPGCQGVHLIRGSSWWRTCWVYHEYMGRTTAPKWFKTRQDKLEAVRDRFLAHPEEEKLALEWNLTRKNAPGKSEKGSWRAREEARLASHSA